MGNNLPNFSPGRPLLGEVTSDKLNAIVAAIRANRPVAGNGIWVQQQNDGIQINALGKTGTGKTRTQDAHPFKVLTNRVNEKSPYRWGVVPDSKLFKLIAPNGETKIDKLLRDTGDIEDDGWLGISNEYPDFIYLEYKCKSQTASITSVGSAEVPFDPNAYLDEPGAWLEMDMEASPPVPKVLRKVIARADAPETNGGEPVIVQGIKQHQLLQDIVYDGFVAQWPFDYSSVEIAPS